MIRITIERDSLGHVIEFEVSGHAGFDQPGRDLVCCAVSAIVQTAVMGLTDVVGIDVMYEQESGWARCVVPLEIPLDKREKASVILDTMLVGLKSVEMGYSEYISINEREVE